METFAVITDRLVTGQGRGGFNEMVPLPLNSSLSPGSSKGEFIQTSFNVTSTFYSEPFKRDFVDFTNQIVRC